MGLFPLKSVMDNKRTGISSLLTCSFEATILILLVVVNPIIATINETTAQINHKLGFEHGASNFIGESIISAHHSNCSLILVSSENESFSSDFITILSVLINKNLTTSTTLMSHQLNVRVSENLVSQKKFTSTCNVVVTLISSIIPSDCHLLKQLTLTNNKEVTKRDEDYYIFIATSEQVSRSLLNSQTAFLLRYKIVFYPHIIKESGSSEMHARLFSIQTLCIYCPENEDRIIPVIGETMSLSSIFSDPTRNLHQFPIPISAPTKYLPTYEMHKLNGKYRHKRGIHTFVFNTVSEKINMSYTLKPCLKFGNIPEGTSGVLLGNGTWAGCMGDVIRGISDMALSISPDDRRVHYVHFTVPLEYAYVTYTTSKPRLFYSWKTVFTALKAATWALVIASILVASVLIFLMDNHYHGSESYISSNNQKLFDTGMYLMGYIIGQGMPTPSSFSSKFMYIIWLYYGLLIGTIYASSLQALIVSPGFDYVPRTFTELVSSKYEWGAGRSFRDGLGEQLFKNSDNPIMRTLYHKMKGDPDEVICTRKTLSKYACFNWDIIENFYLQTQFADKTGNHPFQMSTETTFFASLNFITRKRELYRSHFNNFISRSYNAGLLKQTISMDWRKYRLQTIKAKRGDHTEDLSQSTNKEGPQPFQVDNVKGCFIVLFCGIMTSMASFLWEKVISKAYPFIMKTLKISCLKQITKKGNTHTKVIQK